jgi:hypothetical protein
MTLCPVEYYDPKICAGKFPGCYKGHAKGVAEYSPLRVAVRREGIECTFPSWNCSNKTMGSLVFRYLVVSLI